MQHDDTGHPGLPHDLHGLVAQGDWACEHEQGGGLAEVAHLLVLCVAPPEQFELLEIERLAVTDMKTARSLWQSISPGLRCKLFGNEDAHELRA